MVVAWATFRASGILPAKFISGRSLIKKDKKKLSKTFDWTFLVEIFSAKLIFSENEIKLGNVAHN